MLSGIEHNSKISSYGMVTKKVVDIYLSFNENFKTFGMILKFSGFSIGTIPINHRRRKGGSSNYSFLKRLDLGLDIVLANSNRPLKISIYLGIVFFIISIVFISIIFYKYYFLGHVQALGWSSLIVSIFGIGGIISISLGFIGLYLGRVYDEVKNRPFYIVHSELN